ncbi:hypothetical protein ACQWF0_25110, partial [Salmonella enterica subsp. enterica serovar Infantis]
KRASYSFLELVAQALPCVRFVHLFLFTYGENHYEYRNTFCVGFVYVLFIVFVLGRKKFGFVRRVLLGGGIKQLFLFGGSLPA